MAHINYVIATYAGKTNVRDEAGNKRKGKCELTLKIHLQHLLNYSHNLAQITIMKASVDPWRPTHAEYYSVDDVVQQLGCKVVFMDVPNYGFSNGQYMCCFEKYRDNFDYYILTEDDYIPSTDNFDTKFKEEYTRKFPDDIGFLCSFRQGRPLHPDHEAPLHYSGPIIVSSKSLQKLYDHEWRWGANPQKAFELFTSVDDVFYGYALPGGRDQVIFSHLFTLAGMDIQDYLDKYVFRYWEDYGCNIFIFDQPLQRSDRTDRIYSLEVSKNISVHELFIPIQLSPLYIF